MSLSKFLGITNEQEITSNGQLPKRTGYLNMMMNCLMFQDYFDQYSKSTDIPALPQYALSTRREMEILPQFLEQNPPGRHDNLQDLPPFAPLFQFIQTTEKALSGKMPDWLTLGLFDLDISSLSPSTFSTPNSALFLSPFEPLAHTDQVIPSPLTPLVSFLTDPQDSSTLSPSLLHTIIDTRKRDVNLCSLVVESPAYHASHPYITWFDVHQVFSSHIRLTTHSSIDKSESLGLVGIGTDRNSLIPRSPSQSHVIQSLFQPSQPPPASSPSTLATSDRKRRRVEGMQTNFINTVLSADAMLLPVCLDLMELFCLGSDIAYSIADLPSATSTPLLGITVAPKHYSRWLSSLISTLTNPPQQVTPTTSDKNTLVHMHADPDSLLAGANVPSTLHAFELSTHILPVLNNYPLLNQLEIINDALSLNEFGHRRVNPNQQTFKMRKWRWMILDEQRRQKGMSVKNIIERGQSGRTPPNLARQRRANKFEQNTKDIDRQAMQNMLREDYLERIREMMRRVVKCEIERVVLLECIFIRQCEPFHIRCSSLLDLFISEPAELFPPAEQVAWMRVIDHRLISLGCAAIEQLPVVMQNVQDKIRISRKEEKYAQEFSGITKEPQTESMETFMEESLVMRAIEECVTQNDVPTLCSILALLENCYRSKSQSAMSSNIDVAPSTNLSEVSRRGLDHHLSHFPHFFGSDDVNSTSVTYKQAINHLSLKYLQIMIKFGYKTLAEHFLSLLNHLRQLILHLHKGNNESRQSNKASSRMLYAFLEELEDDLKEEDEKALLDVISINQLYSISDDAMSDYHVEKNIQDKMEGFIEETKQQIVSRSLHSFTGCTSEEQTSICITSLLVMMQQTPSLFVSTSLCNTAFCSLYSLLVKNDETPTDAADYIQNLSTTSLFQRPQTPPNKQNLPIPPPLAHTPYFLKHCPWLSLSLSAISHVMDVLECIVNTQVSIFDLLVISAQNSPNPHSSSSPEESFKQTKLQLEAKRDELIFIHSIVDSGSLPVLIDQFPVPQLETPSFYLPSFLFNPLDSPVAALMTLTALFFCDSVDLTTDFVQLLRTHPFFWTSFDRSRVPFSIDTFQNLQTIYAILHDLYLSNAQRGHVEPVHREKKKKRRHVDAESESLPFTPVSSTLNFSESAVVAEDESDILNDLMAAVSQLQMEWHEPIDSSLLISFAEESPETGYLIKNGLSFLTQWVNAATSTFLSKQNDFSISQYFTPIQPISLNGQDVTGSPSFRHALTPSLDGRLSRDRSLSTHFSLGSSPAVTPVHSLIADAIGNDILLIKPVTTVTDDMSPREDEHLEGSAPAVVFPTLLQFFPPPPCNVDESKASELFQINSREGSQSTLFHLLLLRNLIDVSSYPVPTTNASFEDICTLSLSLLSSSLSSLQFSPILFALIPFISRHPQHPSSSFLNIRLLTPQSFLDTSHLLFYHCHTTLLFIYVLTLHSPSLPPSSFFSSQMKTLSQLEKHYSSISANSPTTSAFTQRLEMLSNEPVLKDMSEHPLSSDFGLSSVIERLHTHPTEPTAMSVLVQTENGIHKLDDQTLSALSHLTTTWREEKQYETTEPSRKRTNSHRRFLNNDDENDKQLNRHLSRSTIKSQSSVSSVSSVPSIISLFGSLPSVASKVNLKIVRLVALLLRFSPIATVVRVLLKLGCTYEAIQLYLSNLFDSNNPHRTPVMLEHFPDMFMPILNQNSLTANRPIFSMFAAKAAENPNAAMFIDTIFLYLFRRNSIDTLLSMMECTSAHMAEAHMRVLSAILLMSRVFSLHHSLHPLLAKRRRIDPKKQKELTINEGVKKEIMSTVKEIIGQLRTAVAACEKALEMNAHVYSGGDQNEGAEQEEAPQTLNTPSDTDSTDERKPLEINGHLEVSFEEYCNNQKIFEKTNVIDFSAPPEPSYPFFSETHGFRFTLLGVSGQPLLQRHVSNPSTAALLTTPYLNDFISNEIVEDESEEDGLRPCPPRLLIEASRLQSNVLSAIAITSPLFDNALQAITPPNNTIKQDFFIGHKQTVLLVNPDSLIPHPANQFLCIFQGISNASAIIHSLLSPSASLDEAAAAQSALNDSIAFEYISFFGLSPYDTLLPQLKSICHQREWRRINILLHKIEGEYNNVELFDSIVLGLVEHIAALKLPQEGKIFALQIQDSFTRLNALLSLGLLRDAFELAVKVNNARFLVEVRNKASEIGDTHIYEQCKALISQMIGIH
ncbi:hypothetical protein BLNAU_3589 [Blattamonas nauphoetae]|uniref:ZFYVE26-like TPR repeats domain-containing protein n=1 Tax=Blattamonas nauphoetae TaxID=2049346 RepID=A0ABQ9YCG9_9EUKA|nr:hypothetical protein BLNAU_3589 [Blattamonas nauphoetae]